ncbi:MAG: hypothetical protein U9N13_01335 [Euryarchaeota archaeon]|nr:hypothetical protein [Euryarchaeota archaeon]
MFGIGIYRLGPEWWGGGLFLATIKQKEILLSLLQKTYWIEVEMEQLVVWESRIELMGEDREALAILSNDSDGHRLIVEKWLNKARIPIPDKAPPGLPVKKFDFAGMDSRKMFREIMKYEILARDSYTDIENADSSIIDEMFDDEQDQKDFLSDMRKLIADEEKHRKICDNRVGGYKTIY